MYDRNMLALYCKCIFIYLEPHHNTPFYATLPVLFQHRASHLDVTEYRITRKVRCEVMGNYGNYPVITVLPDITTYSQLMAL
jgi:hypothetical protein